MSNLMTLGSSEQIQLSDTACLLLYRTTGITTIGAVRLLNQHGNGQSSHRPDRNRSYQAPEMHLPDIRT